MIEWMSARSIIYIPYVTEKVKVKHDQKNYMTSSSVTCYFKNDKG